MEYLVRRRVFNRDIKRYSNIYEVYKTKNPVRVGQIYKGGIVKSIRLVTEDPRKIYSIMIVE